MSIFLVDEKTCSKCGACIEVCPRGIISLQDGGYPEQLPVADETCDKCGACLIVCPSDSFIHRDIPLGECLPIESALEIGFDQCAQLIKTRRSIRSYKDKPVAREDIARLIDIARYSPTGNNIQNVRWLVFDDKDEIQRFREVGNDWMIGVLRNAPAYAPLADIFLKRKEAGIDGFLRGAPAIVATYGPNAPGSPPGSLVALAYFDLAANSMGLGCCWNGFFTGAANNLPPIKEAIGLPEGQQIYGSMLLGYPKYKYHRMPIRNTANVTWR